MYKINILLLPKNSLELPSAVLEISIVVYIISRKLTKVIQKLMTYSKSMTFIVGFMCKLFPNSKYLFMK